MKQKQRILILGGSGLLGINWAAEKKELCSIILGIHNRNVSLSGVQTRVINLDSSEIIIEQLKILNPDLVVNTIGLTDVEQCQLNYKMAERIHVELAKNVAESCAALNISLVHISTDHLYSGENSFIEETYPINAQNIYGETKAKGENIVLNINPDALVIRTNFYGWGPTYRNSFSDYIIESLRSGIEIKLFKDVYFTPILVKNLINAIHQLIDKKRNGIFNVVCDERVSKYDFGKIVAKVFKLDTSLIKEGYLSQRKDLVKRPTDMSLSNKKTTKLLGYSQGSVLNQVKELQEQEASERIQEIIHLSESKEMNIPYGRHYINDDDTRAVMDVLKGPNLTQGPAIEEFESVFSKYVGSNYAVAVSSGTAALHLASIASGLSANSSLVTSPMTFVASANIGHYADAKVLFSDIDPETINICPKKLKDTLEENQNTKIIVPVHFAGLPCDMVAIKSVAENANTAIIEDASHALGAYYSSGQKVGSCSHSDMTVFSFHPVKTIAAGEGGMITTNDEEIFKKLITLRSHGITKNPEKFLSKNQAETEGKINPWYYEMQDLGYNYRITDIQSALALSQMKKLDQFIDRRRYLVERYDNAFLGMKNLRPAQNLGRKISGHHLYLLRIKFTEIQFNRAQLMIELRTRGIGTQVHYLPVPMHPFYNKFKYDIKNYQNSLNYYDEALSIPLYYGLSDYDQDRVISSIKDLID